MKVNLAGYNVDTAVLKELEQKAGKRNDITPEVISAAYARISRDPRSISDIRAEARQEVERARKSNSTIIFKMGHHSVAEHAVFNLDIIGVSRLAMEEVEKFRLCSYTEKSQRYITLDKDYVIPDEIRGTEFEQPFVDIINLQNDAYAKLYALLREHVFKKHATLAQDSKNQSMLEGWAKEDARYITSLATQSQVGLTINARNLELLLRRFASHPCAEVQELGRIIYDRIVEIAPSIIIFSQSNPLDRDTYPQLHKLAGSYITAGHDTGSSDTHREVRLVDYTTDADSVIATALLHSSSDLSWEQCSAIVKKLSSDEKMQVYKTSWRNMQFYDSPIREFEYVNLTYAIILSAACFGQLKRHRMTSITAQPYNPRLGITIPVSIKEIGKADFFTKIAEKSAELYDAINRESLVAAPYILTNAHRRRILLQTNARELYHIARLREDAHAQWDIQNISRAMSEQAREVMPMVCGLLGGKDSYTVMYQQIFGNLPAITEAVLPGVKKIK